MKLFSLFVVAVLIASPSAGQTPGKIDLEAAEMVAELIGAPVFAMDGSEIGKVADILLDEVLQPRRLRMTTGAMLGFGARSIELPKESFMAVRGAVILLMPVEAAQRVPALRPRSEEK